MTISLHYLSRLQTYPTLPTLTTRELIHRLLVFAIQLYKKSKMGALSDLIAARAAAGAPGASKALSHAAPEETAISFTSGNKSSKKLAGTTRKQGGKKKGELQSSAKVFKKRSAGNTAEALAQSKEKENEKQLAAALAAVRKFTQQRAELPPSAMLEQAGLEEAVRASAVARKQGKKGSSTILASGSEAPGSLGGQERDEVERNERTLFVGNVLIDTM